MLTSETSLLHIFLSCFDQSGCFWHECHKLLTWSAIPNGVHEGVQVVTTLCSNFFFKPIYSLVIPWMHHVVLAKIIKDVDTIF
jgi:hypothetical protein